MSGPIDQLLLTAWADRHDETAFQALLGRYGGFVYGVALRRVANPELAQEISQDVFARLAHRAGELLEHPSLAGWLHRATMLLALDRLRRQARLDRKLRTLSNMTEVSRTNDDLWADAQPHLDAALDGLSTRDRDILMLHFVERQTFLEIGQRFHASADAMRMRANRALAAMAQVLRKKGVIVPVALLWSGLGNTLSHAAPPALLALTPAMFSSTGKVTLLTTIIHTMQTTKTTKTLTTAALVLLLPLPLVLQQREIAATEARIESARSADLAREEWPRSAVGGTFEGLNSRQGFDFKSLGNDALDEDYFAIERIRSAICTEETPNLIGLIQTVMGGTMLPDPRDKLLEHLLAELRKRDLRLYIEWSATVLEQTMPTVFLGAELRDEYRFKSRFLKIESAFREWSMKEPEEARRWAEAHGDDWNRVHFASLETLMLAGMMENDLSHACQLLEKLPTSDCLKVIQNAGTLGNAERVLQFSEWAASLGDVEKRRKLLDAGLRGREKDAERKVSSRSIVEAISLNDDDRTWLATRLVTSQSLKRDLSLEHDAFTWFDKILPPTHASYAKGVVLGQIWESEKAFAYISSQLSRQPDDDLIAGFIEAPNGIEVEGHRVHGEIGFHLATRIQEPQRRSGLLAQTWADLQRKEPETALALLASGELSPEDRTMLQKLASTKNRP